ncbi:MAG: GNAT family N-acetyltransferase [Fibrobacter sp.]|nr:GNAT family N-acetyltransferase [Fibrobacter sp.]
MDDGIMNAYVHYLLVRPEYQGKGFGKILVDKVHEIYKDYLRIVVVAYNEELAFYEHCGFKKPMTQALCLLRACGRRD